MLDHIERFELSEEELKKYFNEIRSLKYLSVGLDYLYRSVKKFEREAARRIDPNIQLFSYGNDPAMAGIPQDFIACCFHWYSVSVYNYALLVGWLMCEGGKNTKSKDYAAKVLPEVSKWRNKVSAHFAKAVGDNRDTIADQQLSILYPIAWNDDAFYASPMTLMIKRSGKSSTSENLPRWSLTKVHEHLQIRYWPLNKP